MSRRNRNKNGRGVDWEDRLSLIVSGFGVVVFLLGLIVLIGGNVYLGATDAEYAKHDESMYALFQSVVHFWWAYMMLIGGAILVFIGKLI